MNLEQLEAFVCVATLGGFTRATAQLHRSQPAVSRRIGQLERTLGVALFERRGRAVTLTLAGRTFLPYAQAAMAAVRDGTRLLAESESGLCAGPPLTVALVGSLADTHLPAALRDFRHRHPQAEVTLRTATSREVSDLVVSGDAELGVRYFSDTHPNLAVIPLGAERLSVVAGAHHRLAGAAVVEVSDLAGEHWLSFPARATQPDSFGNLLQRELLRHGIAQPRITVVDSLTAQKRLVEAGYGIAPLPAAICREELAVGALVVLPVRGFEAAQPVVAIYRRSQPLRARAQAFLDTLSQHGGETLLQHSGDTLSQPARDRLG